MHSASPKKKKKKKRKKKKKKKGIDICSAVPQFHSASFHSYPVSTLPIHACTEYPNNQIGASQRASPTDRQRRLLVPTHPEIASESDSSPLGEGLKMEPIEAMALWIHEVVVGEAGADGVWGDCMAELSGGGV